MQYLAQQTSRLCYNIALTLALEYLLRLVVQLGSVQRRSMLKSCCLNPERTGFLLANSGAVFLSMAIGTLLNLVKLSEP